MSALNDLLQRRDRIVQCLAKMRAARADTTKIGADGRLDATFAAAWAAVMMVTDILKIAMTAGNKQAAAQFALQDKMVEKADRLMQMFGSSPMTKKSDLMAQIDPNLKTAAGITKSLRDAQSAINKAATELKMDTSITTNFGKWGLVAKIGIEMADDTLLLIQAGQIGDQAIRGARMAQSQIDRLIAKQSENLAAIDYQINEFLIRIRTA